MIKSNKELRHDSFKKLFIAVFGTVLIFLVASIYILIFKDEEFIRNAKFDLNLEALQLLFATSILLVIFARILILIKDFDGLRKKWKIASLLEYLDGVGSVSASAGFVAILMAISKKDINFVCWGLGLLIAAFAINFICSWGIQQVALPVTSSSPAVSSKTVSSVNFYSTTACSTIVSSTNVLTSTITSITSSSTNFSSSSTSSDNGTSPSE